MNSIGAIIVATFAVVWVAAGAQQLGRRPFAVLFTIAILISAAIVVAALRIPFGPATSGRFDGKIYGIVVTLEAVAILCAALFLNRTNRKEFLIPVIGFIVGAHFFGMVPALRSNEFWWVGGAMCLLPILTMWLLQRRHWAPAVGFGCAVILWVSALAAFF